MKWLRELLARPKPCELCHLGEDQWDSLHSAIAEWRFEGPTSNHVLMVCGPCREFLIASHLAIACPMEVLSHLVAAGRANRVAPWRFLQNATWCRIWMSILAVHGRAPSDLATTSRWVSQIAEEYYRRAGYDPDPHDVPRLDKEGRLNVGAGLRKLMKDYGIPMEVVERKYASYLVALKASGRSSNWNADIDDDARKRGALTHKEIQAARTDLHKAILNRVKLALHSEGFFLLPTEDEDASPPPRTQADEPSVPTGTGESGDGEFPTVIPVPGYTDEVVIPVVSLSEAKSEEELQSLYTTAMGGAANLLVPLVIERTQGAVTLEAARACAISAVAGAVEGNLANSEDTQGYYYAGRTLFESWWAEWMRTGDPVGALTKLYETEEPAG